MAKMVPVTWSVPYAVDPASFKDALGNPTSVESVLSVDVSDPALAEVTASEDKMSGSVKIIGVGSVQLQVAVDVRFGDEVKPLTLTADIQGTPGEAVSGSLSLGDAVPPVA
jgi:hypothetical protein